VAVSHFLEAVVHEASHKADLAAVFLTKYCGFRPRKDSVGPGTAAPEDDPIVRRARTVLLNLAAALRILEWERAGFQPALPPSLPTAAEAFSAVASQAEPAARENQSAALELSHSTLRTWLRCFSRSGRSTLGTDVLLPSAPVEKDDLLDALADLLWQNRHLCHKEL
jgi:hypothetical protein